jgi:Tfp pilus assembly protein PilF
LTTGHVQAHDGGMGLIAAVKTIRQALAVVLTLLLLAGCAMPPAAVPPAVLFHDAWFQPPTAPVRPAQAMEASPAMQEFVAREVARVRQRGPGSALIDGLLASGRLKLEYDSDITRNAAEAFEARTGNCLSLVLMTAAIAKEAGLRVHYHQVETGGAWARSGTLLMNLAHVRISIARDRLGSWVPGLPVEWVMVDFMPDAASARAPSWELTEARIVAMYLNNRAAEHLIAGRIDEAYWQARAAVETDPDYVDGINTLAVVYLRHGRAAAAVGVLQHAMALDATNRHVLGNLAGAWESSGHPDEAAAVRAQLSRVERVRPFQDYEDGLRAMEAGDYEAARRLFLRELRRNGLQFDELHLNLARVYLRFHDVAEARRQLEKALDVSMTRQRQAIYAAKLQALDAARSRPSP